MSKKRYFFVKVMYSAPPPYGGKNNIFCKRDPILPPLIRSKRYFFVKEHLILEKRYFFVNEHYSLIAPKPLFFVSWMYSLLLIWSKKLFFANETLCRIKIFFSAFMHLIFQKIIFFVSWMYSSPYHI